MTYTTPNKVRNLLPDLLTECQDIGVVDSGTFMQLDNSAKAVPTILKDATELVVTTDYTFIQPRAISLTVAADGENFIAHTHIAFSDDEINEFIGQSDRIIDNEFANQATPADEYLDDWSQWLTAWKIKVITAKGDEDLLKEAMVYRDMAMDAINDYKANTLVGTHTYSAGTRTDAEPVGDLSLDQSTTPQYPY